MAKPRKRTTMRERMAKKKREEEKLMPSPRALLAQRIADFINEHELNSPFGGDVTVGGEGRRKYRAIPFSTPARLDGIVSVYSPRFIQIQSSGPNGDGQHVFESEGNALAYMKARWVDYDQEAADAVPRREAES